MGERYLVSVLLVEDVYICGRVELYLIYVWLFYLHIDGFQDLEVVIY